MINEKYSYKDFTGQTFVDVNPEEFNNSEIHGSCFWHENKPDTKVFPDGVEGLVLVDCNACNVLITEGISISGRTVNHRVKVQNPTIDNPDNMPEEWILDENDNPIEPLNKKRFIKEGRSQDPKDIQKDFYREEEIGKWYWDNTYGKGDIPYKSWFREAPEILESTTKEVTMEVGMHYPESTYGLDSVPSKVGEVTRYGLTVVVDGKVVKANPPIPKQLIQIRGTKTTHKVRGRAWLYKGQEKE